MKAIRPKHSFRLAWIGLAVVIASLLALGIFQLITMNIDPKQTATPTSSNEAAPPPATIVSIESNLLFTGNTFWGRYINDAAQKTNDPYGFPFSRLNEFGRDNYDAWITGLECPVTQKGTSMTSADMAVALQFNCDPAYLPNFAKWFDVVTLANNHMDNQGADGFTETQQQLENNEIQYFGHYDPDVLQDVCDVISVPVRAIWSDETSTEELLPMAMCGYNGVFKIPSAASLAEVKKYAQYMPVIAMPHSGQEYVAEPDAIKTTMDHTLIDNGAAMVLGDHPHWVQSSEVYKGKLIVYSMGNFMFDQQRDNETIRSAAIKVSLEDSLDDASVLARWLELGKQCKQYNDDCLKQASTQGLKKLDLTYTFDVVATDNSGYVTHVASKDVQTAVEQRLNWQQTMEQLTQ